MPKLAGLSSYEYAVDGGLRYYCAEAQEEHLDEATMQRYRKFPFINFLIYILQTKPSIVRAQVVSLAKTFR